MWSVWVLVTVWLLCIPWGASLYKIQSSIHKRESYRKVLSPRYGSSNDAGGVSKVSNKRPKERSTSDNIINSINSLSQSVNNNNSDVQDVISHAFSLCVMKCKNGDKENGWNYATSILKSCEDNNIVLNVYAKALFVKSAVISNSIADLALLTSNSSLYNILPLPDSFTLENNMRVFWNNKYIYELLYIMTPYITSNLVNYNNYILSEQCYGYLIKALPLYLQSRNLASNSGNIAGLSVYNSKSIIRTILEMSLVSHNNTITPSLIITALSSCRELDDWQSALQVYNFAKINARKKYVIDTPSTSDPVTSTISVLPSIIYGQTIVTLAKGGVEAELFQVICEMLEDGIVPSTLTVNLLMLELSKRGAYKTMIIIVDQLYRYGISTSNMALNSILNACDKVGAYDRVLAYYQEKKISLKQLDSIGISILIKACDRLSLPAVALSIIESAYHSTMTGLLTHSIYERVFALLVKEGKGMLAAKLLLMLEIDGNKALTSLLDDESIDDKEAISYLEFKELFNDLISITTPTCNITYYTATISALSREGYAIESSLLLNAYMRYVRESRVLVDATIENNIITMYTSAISSFRHLQDPDTAEKLFNQIYYESSLHSTIELRSDIFSSLLIVYALSNVPKERFELLLYRMKKDGLQWSSHTYTAVICYLMAQEDYNRVIALWNEMIVNNIAPTTTCITEVLKACVLTKQGIKALEVVNYAYHLVTNIRDGGPNPGNVKLNLPDLAMYNKVLIALNQDNKVDESLLVLDLMRDRGITASMSCYVIVLSTMEKNAEWKKAVSLLLQLQTNGVKVDSKLVNLAIAACYRASEWSMIIKLYELMPTLTRNKFIPNQYTYMQAIGAACKLQNSTIALSIYDKMMISINGQLRGNTSSSSELVLPSIAMSSLLVSLLESSQRYNESVQIFESLICCHLSCELYDGDMIIDLHGFSIALARATVRSALNTLRSYYHSNKQKPNKNLVIITGIGRNSRERLEPVLKPSIIGWLQSDFEPALMAKEAANNPGRLVVSSQALANYFNSQQQ